jgi:hypothetical protein
MKRRIDPKHERRIPAKYPFLARVANIALGYEDKYPFKEDDTVLVTGEIDLMPGHVVVVLKDGRTVFGYHDENFVPLTEEEV